jgi:hypothetical protein
MFLVHFQARRPRQLGVEHDTDAGDNDIGLDLFTALSTDRRQAAIALKGGYLLVEQELNAALFILLAHELAEFRTGELRPRLLVMLDHSGRQFLLHAA